MTYLKRSDADVSVYGRTFGVRQGEEVAVLLVDHQHLVLQEQKSKLYVTFKYYAYKCIYCF